jgi:hypothetical protein
MASKPAAATDSGTNDAEPTNTNDHGNPSTAPTVPSDHINQEDLPFLVTHYLANFHKEEYKEESKASSLDPEQKEALDRIRRATNEIASAFSTLGAYGTSYRVSKHVGSDSIVTPIYLSIYVVLTQYLFSIVFSLPFACLLLGNPCHKMPPFRTSVDSGPPFLPRTCRIWWEP